MEAGTVHAILERQPRRGVQLVSSLAIIAVLAIPAAAFAAKGGGSVAPAWISLNAPAGFVAAGPSLGSRVSFSSGYPSTTKNPWVSVTCYQGETMVYGEGGSPNHEFALGGASSRWLELGGSASCRAELGDLYWRGGKQYYRYMAHTAFEAEG